MGEEGGSGWSTERSFLEDPAARTLYCHQRKACKGLVSVGHLGWVWPEKQRNSLLISRDELVALTSQASSPSQGY